MKKLKKILLAQLLRPRMLAFNVLTIRWEKKSTSGHWGAARTEDGASRARPGSEDTAPDCSGGCFIWDQERSGPGLEKPGTQPASHNLHVRT